jgi:hypothetical protein
MPRAVAMIETPSSTSWNESRSPVTIVTGTPAAFARSAIEAITSSAS